MSITVGVLALQGDFAEHARMLEKCGAKAIEIRRAGELALIDGLVIPGGESTTVAKLTLEGLDAIFDTISARARAGMPIYGTCMGSIFLAREIEGSTQGRLALMDVCVRRNAFGSQRNSFECELDIPELGDRPVHAVFIRGPIILSCGPQVTAMAKLPQGIVMARQDNLLVTAFHPEITDDDRIHRYFLSMITESRSRQADSVAVQQCCQEAFVQ